MRILWVKSNRGKLSHINSGTAIQIKSETESRIESEKVTSAKLPFRLRFSYQIHDASMGGLLVKRQSDHGNFDLGEDDGLVDIDIDVA